VNSVLVSPKRLIEACKAQQSPTVAFTYSEPVVFYEYMHDSAALGRKQGVGSVMISNGYIQEKPIRELSNFLTAVKIDLKAFTERFYEEQCNAELEPVLHTLVTLKDIGIWFEIVVLIIPTLNDSPEEIHEMSKWVVENLGPDVPMHFSRFYPTYRVMNLPRTPVSTVERCRKIALEAGVHYAYAGNVPMHPGGDTYCHHCQRTLIQRAGHRIIANAIQDGKCPDCGCQIPGVWSQDQALAYEPHT
jgi:pyruvate formate lyase activating enzyme